MTNMFATMDLTTPINQENQRVSSYRILDTDVYKGKVVATYYIPPVKGAASQSVPFIIVSEVDTPQGPYEFRSTHYIIGRDGTNLTKDRKGVNPNYVIVDNLIVMTLGRHLNDENNVQEMRTFKVWDYASKQNVDREYPSFTELVGAPVSIAIQKKKRFKSMRNPDGSYTDTDVVQETNEVVTFFHPENGATLPEIQNYYQENNSTLDEAMKDRAFVARAGKIPGSALSYHDTWLASNRHVTRDMTAGRVVAAPKAAATTSSDSDDTPW